MKTWLSHQWKIRLQDQELETRTEGAEMARIEVRHALEVSLVRLFPDCTPA